MKQKTLLRKAEESQAIQWTGDNFWNMYLFIFENQTDNEEAPGVSLYHSNDPQKGTLVLVYRFLETRLSKNEWLSHVAGKFVKLTDSEVNIFYEQFMRKRGEIDDHP